MVVRWSLWVLFCWEQIFMDVLTNSFLPSYHLQEFHFYCFVNAHHQQAIHKCPSHEQLSGLKWRAPPPLMVLNGEWAAPRERRQVKLHFSFFHLRPGNQSPDNTHTFDPGNWKVPVCLHDTRPYWNRQVASETITANLKLDLFFFFLLYWHVEFGVKIYEI